MLGVCAAMPRDRLSALVVIDEAALRDAVDGALRADGFEVQTVADSPGVLTRLSTHRIDVLVVAEVEACTRLRAAAGNGVATMLLVHGDAEGRVAGLEAGADDCLSRPFLARELTARLRSIARRTAGHLASGAEARSYADLRLDRRAHRSWRGRRELGLTPTEFMLLDFLVEHAEQVAGRSRIHTEVWGYDFGASSNSLAVYVSYLRRKLEAEGEPRLVHTVRGVGYVLRGE